MNKKSMQQLGREAVRINKLYKACEDRGYHNKIDASYTDWKGGYHELYKCLDCNVIFYFPDNEI